MLLSKQPLQQKTQGVVVKPIALEHDASEQSFVACKSLGESVADAGIELVAGEHESVVGDHAQQWQGRHHVLGATSEELHQRIRLEIVLDQRPVCELENFVELVLEVDFLGKRKDARLVRVERLVFLPNLRVLVNEAAHNVFEEFVVEPPLSGAAPLWSCLTRSLLRGGGSPGFTPLPLCRWRVFSVPRLRVASERRVQDLLEVQRAVEVEVLAQTWMVLSLVGCETVESYHCFCKSFKLV